MMPNLYIIIGEGNTKKSSIIRALSGAYDKGNYKIEDADGKILNFQIFIRSLQEAKISIEDFFKKVPKEVENVLLALRIEKINGFPCGIGYITAFLNQDHYRIKQLVVLGTNALDNIPKKCPPPIYFPESGNRDIPSNRFANKIREIWRWK